MALNIGRRAAPKKAASADAETPPEAQPLIVPEAVAPLEPAADEPKPRARRAPRGTSTRAKRGAAGPEAEAAEAPSEAPEAVAPPSLDPEEVLSATPDPEPEPVLAEAPAEDPESGNESAGAIDLDGDSNYGERGGRRRRRRGRGGSGGHGGGNGDDANPAGDPIFNEDPPTSRPSVGRREAEPAPLQADATLANVMRSLEFHSRQVEKLMKMQEDLARRVQQAPQGPAGAASGAVAQRQRVGIFVDSANIELALDRTRNRIDWKRVLDLLTRDRVLVKAIAYSPVHDDPAVSIETQRFVEPFLDSGFKVVTKPLKRFADGSIKANIDVELAMDVMTMVDRLDVVVLVSGDGDFVRLVEVTQAKGVRVEVASVQSSTAGNLRYASDYFYDLGRLNLNR